MFIILQTILYRRVLSFVLEVCFCSCATTRRIIAITSVRIKYFFDLDPADITYTFSKISLLSSMVPILGIINANLPILGPAFKRIFNSSLLTSTVKKSNMTTSSASQFRRIADGEYPLVNIDGKSRSPLDGVPRSVAWRWLC